MREQRVGRVLDRRSWRPSLRRCEIFVAEGPRGAQNVISASLGNSRNSARGERRHGLRLQGGAAALAGLPPGRVDRRHVGDGLHGHQRRDLARVLVGGRCADKQWRRQCCLLSSHGRVAVQEITDVERSRSVHSIPAASRGSPALPHCEPPVVYSGTPDAGSSPTLSPLRRINHPPRPAPVPFALASPRHSFRLATDSTLSPAEAVRLPEAI